MAKKKLLLWFKVKNKNRCMHCQLCQSVTNFRKKTKYVCPYREIVRLEQKACNFFK